MIDTIRWKEGCVELIDQRLIRDSMAAWVMSKARVDCAIVGSDRIASNGDVANKIGTYDVAISAKAHGIPFYVVAPFDVTPHPYVTAIVSERGIAGEPYYETFSQWAKSASPVEMAPLQKPTPTRA
jgi:methylthioribose-1-phosphate isomerase